MPAFDWLLQAFWSLSTERQIGHTTGPIPVSMIRLEGEQILGIDSIMVEPFMVTIRALDWAFLKHCEDQRKKQEGRNDRLQNQNNSRHVRRRKGR